MDRCEYICNCSGLLFAYTTWNATLTELKLDHAMALERDLRDCGVHDNPRNQKHSPKNKRMQHLIFLGLHHDHIALHDQIKTRPLQIWTHRKYSKHWLGCEFNQTNRWRKRLDHCLILWATGHGWWFSNIFLFSPLFGEDDLLTYFSKGLKPPTRAIWFCKVFCLSPGSS